MGIASVAIATIADSSESPVGKVSSPTSRRIFQETPLATEIQTVIV
jgi:hypothetical protein